MMAFGNAINLGKNLMMRITTKCEIQNKIQIVFSNLISLAIY